MRHLTRIRIAALSAAFFLGGLTAAGFGIKSTQDTGSQPVTARPRIKVIHETRTRTVHVGVKRTNPPAGQIQQVPQAQLPVQAAAKVRSRVSPTGGEYEGDEGDDGGETEARDD